MQLIQACTKAHRAGGTWLRGGEQSPTASLWHSHEGQLPVVGFDAADVVRRGAAQHLHQPVQGGSELRSTTGRRSRPAGRAHGGVPQDRAGLRAPPSCTWLEMDFLLLWLLGSDLRLGRPGSQGPLDLRDCRDTAPSPSSRKSSASRADCVEQSREQWACSKQHPTPPQSQHQQDTWPQRPAPCRIPILPQPRHAPGVQGPALPPACPLREPKEKS